MQHRLSIIFSFVFIFFASVISSQEKVSISKQIISFCDTHMGKKVGRGECWDLAKEALDYAGAEWTPPYEYGKELSKTDAVKPGDIIQLEKVKIVYPDKSWQEIPHHTAIIYKVLSPGKYTIAEQNSNNKRFVILSDLDLNYIKKGKYSIYRPH